MLPHLGNYHATVYFGTISPRRVDRTGCCLSVKLNLNEIQNNMLIRPTEEELANFGEPDFIIYNAGQFPANRFTKGMSSTTSVEINFKRMEMVILGTEYAGEMKKGVFSVMVSVV